MTLPGPPTKLRGFLLGSYFLCRCADVLTNKKNGRAVMVTSTDRGARLFLREPPVRRQTGGHAHGYCRLANRSCWAEPPIMEGPKTDGASGMILAEAPFFNDFPFPGPSSAVRSSAAVSKPRRGLTAHIDGRIHLVTGGGGAPEYFDEPGQP
jgi:hypothetical protein